MEIAILASGSKGNCIYLKNDKIAMLIDAGCSLKKISDFISSNNLQAPSAIAITHMHNDHYGNYKRIKDRWTITTTISPENAMPGVGYRLCPESSLYLTPLPASHDSPVFSFLITDALENKSILIATDIGYISQSIRVALENVDHLVIESNYDREMLDAGTYPSAVKERIKSNKGHLSNDEAKEALDIGFSHKLQSAILCHLSASNNTHDKIYTMLRDRDYCTNVRIEPVGELIRL